MDLPASEGSYISQNSVVTYFSYHHYLFCLIPEINAEWKSSKIRWQTKGWYERWWRIVKSSHLIPSLPILMMLLPLSPMLIGFQLPGNQKIPRARFREIRQFSGNFSVMAVIFRAGKSMPRTANICAHDAEAQFFTVVWIWPTRRYYLSFNLFCLFRHLARGDRYLFPRCFFFL